MRHAAKCECCLIEASSGALNSPCQTVVYTYDPDKFTEVIKNNSEGLMGKWTCGTGISFFWLGTFLLLLLFSEMICWLETAAAIMWPWGKCQENHTWAHKECTDFAGLLKNKLRCTLLQDFLNK